jgi:hypothetical protein
MKQIINAIAIIALLVFSGWAAYAISGFMTTDAVARTLLAGIIFVISYILILILSLVVLWTAIQTIQKVSEHVK